MNLNTIQKKLEPDGFVKIPSVLDESKIQICNKVLKQLIANNYIDSSPKKRHKRTRLFNIIYENIIFQDMAINSDVLEIVKLNLGENISMSDFSAHILTPNCEGQKLHIDYPYWMMPGSFQNIPQLSIQVVWLITDFTFKNGATRYGVGSHKFFRQPDKIKFDTISKAVCGKAGDVIISNGLCWHDTLPNQTNKDRISILANYNPAYIKSSIDITSRKRSDRLKEMPPKLLQLILNKL